MAKIFPERLPLSIQEDSKRRAECLVYNALKNLPDAYVVYYSIHWLFLPDTRGIKEGEADFIIAHPQKGIIVLEVKGGGIRFSAEDGQWYSRDFFGNEHEIKDPVQQGSSNFHQLLKQLQQLPGWPDTFLNIGNAVCFPDIYLTKGQVLKPDLRREFILDHNDIGDITPAVERMYAALFGAYLSSGAPGIERMKIIEEYLAHSFALRTPLSVELEAEEERLVTLTEDQFRILSFLGDRKRAAISGCAGSGKTMLAIRKAQQLQALGLNVLLVCFNAPLAEDLRKRLPDMDVYHFHGLCKEAAERYGYKLQKVTEQQYYDDALPQALLDASAQTGPIYDAVIVDEGQDFLITYWMALEPLLKPDGYLYVFYDNNQNLYSGSSDFGGLIEEAPFVLNRNCRNTQMIHELVAKFHDKPQSLTAGGPEGRPPEVIIYNDEEEMLRKLQKLLHRLANEEHIRCEDIVILTPHGEENSKLKSNLKLGMFTLTRFPVQRPNTIQIASVYRFKGLERRLVILAEIDSRKNANMDMILYVGCSRARTHLVLMRDANLSAELAARIQSE